jgi:hypothetical protein
MRYVKDSLLLLTSCFFVSFVVKRFSDHGDIGDCVRFRRSGALRAPRPLPPYVHPISPKVTQSTQEPAEGRNPKNTKRNGFPLRKLSLFQLSHLHSVPPCKDDGLNAQVIIANKIQN